MQKLDLNSLNAISGGVAGVTQTPAGPVPQPAPAPISSSSSTC
jgi:hypothetical protein